MKERNQELELVRYSDRNYDDFEYDLLRNNDIHDEWEAIGVHWRPDLVYYSVAEVGRMLGLGRTSIYQAIRENRLQRTKFGRATRISRASLEAFVQNALRQEAQNV